MRILFTSVGRRVELVQSFHCVAERLGVDLTIIGADVSRSALPCSFVIKQKSCAEYLRAIIFLYSLRFVKKRMSIV